MFIKRTHFLLIVLLFVTSLWSESKEINMIFTGNTHGHPLKFTDSNGKDQGGMAARKTLIDSLMINEKRKDIIIVDAGGVSYGRPESDLYNTKPDIIGMNLIGYDAMGVGTTEISNSFKAYSALNKLSKFYFVNSNVKVKNKNIGDTYMIKTINGTKIAIISVVREDAGQVMSKNAVKEFFIEDGIKSSTELIKVLKEKEKPAVIVALTTLGYDANGDTGVIHFAKSVPDVDIIIEADSGLNDNETFKVGNTFIMTTGEKGLFVGHAKIVVDDAKFSNLICSYHPVNKRVDGVLLDKAVSEDEKLLASLTSLTKTKDKLLQKKIAVVKRGNLTSVNRMSGLSSLTTLVTDAMVSQTGVDAAFINAGAFVDADVKEGTAITMNSFGDILKYDNTVFILSMSGTELEELIKFSMKRIGYGQFLNFSGITVEYSKDEKKVLSIRVGDKIIIGDKKYKVAVTSFLAAGGDNYEILKNNKMKMPTHRSVCCMVNGYLTDKKNVSDLPNTNLVIK